MSEGRHALIVGCRKYDDLNLNSLFKPAKNLLELETVLRSQEYDDFDVLTGLDLDSNSVKHEIRSFFPNRKENDLLLLYLSCHGIKDKNDRLYFAFKNTNLKDLENTAIPLNIITDVLNHAPSDKQILILDCYFSGISDRNVLAKSGKSAITNNQFFKGGRVTITASDEIQRAIVGYAFLPPFNNSFYLMNILSKG